MHVGRDGVTTNAGIPGTGLSYRQKVGKGRGWLGVLLLLAALGWWRSRTRTGSLNSSPN